MRTWLFGFHQKSLYNAFLELENKGEIQIEEWVSRNPHATIQDRDFKALKLPPHQFANEICNRHTDFLKKHFHIFLNVYSRSPIGMGTPLADIENIFWIYTDFLLHRLRTKDIKLIIFSDIPHLGGDYLLYACAKEMGVRTLICSQSQYPNRFFYFSDTAELGLINEDLQKNPLNEVAAIPKSFQKTYFYMSNIDWEYKSCAYAFLKDLRRLLRRKHSRKSALTAINKLFRCAQFKKDYPRNLSHQFDLNQPFVYFPLQLQPELTTDILGNEFADQLLAIEKLQSIIPRDWQIIIKENPKQLEYKRGKYFFQRIKNLENVHYISKKINTYELISRCEFTATITGTAGWESISGGKPTLIFGKTWYRSLPGTIEYREGITHEDVINTTIKHAELETTYNALLSQTATGICNTQYKKIVPDYSDEANTQDLIASFKRILSQMTNP